MRHAPLLGDIDAIATATASGLHAGAGFVVAGDPMRARLPIVAGRIGGGGGTSIVLLLATFTV